MTEPESYYFEENSGIPNNPGLPVLVYRGAVSAADADELEERFRENGWGGVWRWSVYDFHHYHSTAHEVLGVVAGSAELAIGGPDGKTLQVSQGDVIVLPAGAGHRKLGETDGFQVVGAYPEGQENYDLIKIGEPLTEEIRENIRSTSLPESDPLYGNDGPLTSEWRQ